MSASSQPQEGPSVSVVIPAFNAEPFLEDAVRSVLRQTYHKVSCVISDDGSTDGTWRVATALAQSDPRVLIIHFPNGGVSVARNRGAAATNSELLLFLDADDILETDAVASLVDELERYPGAVACHGYADAIDTRGVSIPGNQLAYVFRHRHCLNGSVVARNTPNDATTFFNLAVNNAIISPGAVLIRRQAFKQVGGFNPSFSGSADWDLWIRLSRLSDLPFLDRQVMRYRMSGASMSSNHRKMAKEVQQLRHNIIHDPRNTSCQTAYARRAYRLFYRMLAFERFEATARATLEWRMRTALEKLKLASINLLLSICGRPPFFFTKDSSTHVDQRGAKRIA